MAIRGLWLAVGIILFSSAPARAQIAIGDIFLPEFTTGEVVNLRGGGDLSARPRHATGLSNPMAVCQGPGGRVLVAEFGSGQVTDITEGGDFDGAAPFAEGLDGPMELYCTPTRILVVENLGSEITDITAGGDYAGAPAFASVLNVPAGLTVDGDDRLWLASFSQGLIDVTGGGSFADATIFAPNDLRPGQRSTIAVAEFEGALILANEYTDELRIATAGGPLSSLPVFARLDGPIGVRYLADDGLLLAAGEAPTPSGEGVIYDLAGCPGADPATCAVVFATGVRPFDVAHLGSVRSICGNDVLEPDEPCDDGNQIASDGCTDLCIPAACGDGRVQDGVEACDDGNAVDEDGCLSTCVAASCGDGAIRAGLEGCDFGADGPDDDCNALCQPASCGDGYVQASREQCDDGDVIDDDACTSQCRFAEDVSVWGCGAGPTGGLAALALTALLAALARRRARA